MQKPKSWIRVLNKISETAILVGAGLVWLMSNIGGVGTKIVGDQHYVMIAHRLVASGAAYYNVSRCIYTIELYAIPVTLGLALFQYLIERHDRRTHPTASAPAAGGGLRDLLRKAAIPRPAVAESTEVTCLVAEMVPTTFKLDDRKWSLHGRHLHVTPQH